MIRGFRDTSNMTESHRVRWQVQQQVTASQALGCCCFLPRRDRGRNIFVVLKAKARATLKANFPFQRLPSTALVALVLSTELQGACSRVHSSQHLQYLKVRDPGSDASSQSSGTCTGTEDRRLMPASVHQLQHIRVQRAARTRMH